jgi:hypothetical protein
MINSPSCAGAQRLRSENHLRQRRIENIPSTLATYVTSVELRKKIGCPTTSGAATIATCGAQTSYDTVLYMSGTTCGGAGLGCSDDVTGYSTTSGASQGSRPTPIVTTGTTYYFVVDGYNGRFGSYPLKAIPPP